MPGGGDVLGGAQRQPDNAAVGRVSGLPFGAQLCQTVLAAITLLRPVCRAVPPPDKRRRIKNGVDRY